VRTTIRIEDQLLREAKSVAASTGRTLGEVVEDALREALARRRECGRRERVVLRSFEGHGLQRGVDLDDSAALLGLMEQRDAAS
jgi:hypothetical protein